MRQPDDYNPTPFFKERRSRSGLQTSRESGRREREPVRQSPPCYMQVIHAGPARRDFFRKMHTSAMGNPWPLFLIRNAEFGIRNCGRGLSGGKLSQSSAKRMNRNGNLIDVYHPRPVDRPLPSVRFGALPSRLPVRSALLPAAEVSTGDPRPSPTRTACAGDGIFGGCLRQHCIRRYGHWVVVEFVVAANLAAMQPCRCNPGRRNADATGCPCPPQRWGSCHALTNAVVKPKHTMRVTDEV